MPFSVVGSILTPVLNTENLIREEWKERVNFRPLYFVRHKGAFIGTLLKCSFPRVLYWMQEV